MCLKVFITEYSGGKGVREGALMPGITTLAASFRHKGLFWKGHKEDPKGGEGEGNLTA